MTHSAATATVSAMQLKSVPALAFTVGSVALLVSGCGGASRKADPPATPAVQAQTLQSRFVATVKAVSPSVVEVETPVGLGSGVVLDGKRDVVTNNHVVGSYRRFHVTDSSGKQYAATLVGYPGS
jgi:putative serine protease PepD